MKNKGKREVLVQPRSPFDWINLLITAELPHFRGERIELLSFVLCSMSCSVFMLLLFLFHVMIVCAVWECVFCVSYHRHVVPPVLDTQGNWWSGLTLMGVAWASERSNSLRPWRWTILRWNNLVTISWERNISTWFIWMKYYSCLWNGLKSFY